MIVGLYFVIMTVSSLQLTSAGITKNITDNDSRIVFPGPIVDLSNRYNNEDNKDPCEGLSYCTVKPNDYPQKMFNDMFKGKFKEPIFRPTLAMIDDRQGDPDEEEDCESTISLEPIYKVRSLKGEMLTVVQAAEENFVQMVRLETCTNEGAKCFTKFKPPENVEAFCKQTYNEWEFLVYDGNNGTKKETVALPICCSCFYRTIS